MRLAAISAVAVVTLGAQALWAAPAAPELAWSAAQGFEGLIRECRLVLPEASVPAPAQGKAVESGDNFFPLKALSGLPAPDPKTAAWLASRIPGLDTAALKAVPPAPADQALARAVAAQATYLDVFTDPGLGRGHSELYYLSADVLDGLERKYVSGTLPVTGKTKDGRPFRMQALVAGGGSVYLLYDLAQFSVKEGRNEFKITDAGRVAVSVLGAGDVGLHGLSGCGCKGPFCGCAEIQRITKIAADKVKVQTSRGDQTADISPIRIR